MLEQEFTLPRKQSQPDQPEQLQGVWQVNQHFQDVSKSISHQRGLYLWQVAWEVARASSLRLVNVRQDARPTEMNEIQGIISTVLSFNDSIGLFSAYMLTAGGRARSTVDSYARDLQQFAELTGAGQVAGLNPGHVERWMAELNQHELAASSISRKLSALRSFVNWATDFGHLAKSPIPPEITAPKAMYLPHALDPSEVEKVLQEAQGEGVSSLRDYALLETLYASGMRVSELCNLQLVDLQLGEGFAMVTGKGNKQRLVPLGQYAVAALNRYLAESRGVLCKRASMFNEVFLSMRGPLSRSTAFRIVKKYAALAEIKVKVSPHTFRHSCASHMLAGGADLRLVQELLGHSSLTTTQIYTHIEKSRMRKAYDQTHPLA